jgi:hypothetical protein
VTAIFSEANRTIDEENSDLLENGTDERVSDLDLRKMEGSSGKLVGFETSSSNGRPYSLQIPSKITRFAA